MLLESIILITGLVASYLIIQSAYDRQPLVKLLTSTFTIFMSLMIVFGYYFDRFSMPVFSGYTVIAFLLVVGILLLKNGRHLRLDVEVDKKFTLCFVFVVLVGFVVYILPSLPSFFPVSRNVDSACHFAITNFIAEHNSLLFGGSPYTLFPVWNQYPFGMHLNIALISRLLNLEPIVVLYPFVVFITALTAAVLYGTVVESKISDRFFGLVPAFIILSFYLTHYMTKVMGWWPMIFGIFLVLVFVWLMVDYIKKPCVIRLLPLAIIEIAIVFSYSYWAGIPPLIFLFVLLWSPNLSKKTRLIHLAIFSIIVGALTIDYVVFITTMAKNMIGVGEYKISFVRFLPFDFFGWRIKEPAEAAFTVNTINTVLTLFFAFSIPGVIKSVIDKKNKLLLSFFVAAFLQIFVLGIGVLFFGLRVYPYSKAYYLLMYPAAIFLFVGIKNVVSRLKKVGNLRNSAAFRASFLAILVASVAITGQIMSMGVQATGHQELVMTPYQYDVALWSKNNLPGGNLTYLAETPQALWFYVVSCRNPSDPALVWGCRLDSYFVEWNSTAKTGDIVVVLDISKAKINLDNFATVYKKGDAVVLQKI